MLWLRGGARRAEACCCWRRRRGELGLESCSPGERAGRRRRRPEPRTRRSPGRVPARGLAAPRGTRSAASPRARQARRSPAFTSRLRPPPQLAGWRRHRLLVPGHRCRRCCNPGRTLSHFPAGGAEDVPCTSPGEIAPAYGWRSLGDEEGNPDSAFLEATAAAGSWEGAHRAGAPSGTRESQRPRAPARLR